MMSSFSRLLFMALCLTVLTLGMHCKNQPADSSPDGDAHSDSDSDSDSDGDADINMYEYDESLCEAISDDEMIVVTTDNNYAFKMDMDIELTEVKDGENLLFEWGDVHTDIYGKSMDPLDDIEMVLVSLWNNTPKDLTKRINVDQLPRDENLGAITTFPEGKFADQTLDNFDSFGNPVEDGLIHRIFYMDDPEFDYDPETHTFMIMATSSREPGKESRMIGFFKLNPDESNTTVTLRDDSTILDVEVQLPDADETTPVPTGTADLTFEWEDMVGLWNSLGNEWVAVQINEVAIARYEPDSFAKLVDNFLLFEDEADDWWEGAVQFGDSIDLSSETIGIRGCEKDDYGVVLDDDDRFPGFENDGSIWILYTFCTVTCNNPAPWSITVVQPCDD